MSAEVHYQRYDSGSCEGTVSYTHLGVLVMRLNIAYCFEGMQHFLEDFDMSIYLNELNLEFSQGIEQEKKDGPYPDEYPQGSTWDGDVYKRQA